MYLVYSFKLYKLTTELLNSNIDYALGIADMCTILLYKNRCNICIPILRKYYFITNTLQYYVIRDHGYKNRSFNLLLREFKCKYITRFQTCSNLYMY